MTAISETFINRKKNVRGMNKKLIETIIRSYYDNDKDKLNFFIPLVQNKIRTLKEANVISGTLSKTSKMPCRSYSITAKACQTGEAMKQLNKQKLNITCQHDVEVALLNGKLIPTCALCYCDDRGNYNYPSVKSALNRRLESITDPLWTEALVYMINNEQKKGFDYFRWHDSGDIQSLEHIEQIVVACICTPLVAHWLPTLEAGSHIATFVQKYGSIDKIDNLCVRASTPFINGRAMPNGNTGVRASRVIADDRTLKKEMLTFMNDNICPAKLGDGTCGDCRKCWDKDILVIGYPLKYSGHMLGVKGLVIK